MTSRKTYRALAAYCECVSSSVKPLAWFSSVQTRSSFSYRCQCGSAAASVLSSSSSSFRFIINTVAFIINTAIKKCLRQSEPHEFHCVVRGFSPSAPEINFLIVRTFVCPLSLSLSGSSEQLHQREWLVVNIQTRSKKNKRSSVKQAHTVYTWSLLLSTGVCPVQKLVLSTEKKPIDPIRIGMAHGCVVSAVETIGGIP